MIHNISRNIWIAAAATGGIALVGYLGYKLVRILLEKGGCIGKTDTVAKDKLKEKPEKPLKGDKPKTSDGLENEEAQKANKIAEEVLKLNEAIKKQVAEYARLTEGSKTDPLFNSLALAHPEWIHDLNEVVRSRDPKQVHLLDQVSLSSVRKELNEKIMSYFSVLAKEGNWEALVDVIHLYFYVESKTSESIRELVKSAPDSVKIEVSYHLETDGALLLLQSCGEADVKQEIADRALEKFNELIKRKKYDAAYHFLKENNFLKFNDSIEELDDSVVLKFIDYALESNDANNLYPLMCKTKNYDKVQLLKSLNLFLDSKMPSAVIYFTTANSILDDLTRELYFSLASKVYIQQGKLDEALKLKSKLSPEKADDLEQQVEQYLSDLADRALKDMKLAKDVILSALMLDSVNYPAFLAWVKNVDDSPENKVLFLKSALAKTPVDEADRQLLVDYIAVLEKK